MLSISNQPIHVLVGGTVWRILVLSLASPEASHELTTVLL
jgi:hypothetical protein